MSKSYFEGTSHSLVYGKYRPTPPKALVETIMSYLNEKLSPPFHHMVDFGCGTGQCIQLLAPYFHMATGTDTSQSQIEEAINLNTASNITFKVSPAENSHCKDSSVELITVSQAFHWFDALNFFKEAKRILVPNGVLALIGYLIPKVHHTDKAKEQEANKLISELYSVHFGPFWTEERKMIENSYKDVVLPFNDVVRTSSFIKEMSVTVANLLGYLTSWSAYQMCKEKNPAMAEEKIQYCEERLMKILEANTPINETPITLHVTYFLLMGRKE